MADLNAHHHLQHGGGYTVIMSGPTSAAILSAAADSVPMPSAAVAVPTPPSAAAGDRSYLVPRDTHKPRKNRVNRKPIKKAPTAPMPSDYVHPDEISNGLGRRDSFTGYNKRASPSRSADPLADMTSSTPRPPSNPPPAHSNGADYNGNLAHPQPRPPRVPPHRSSGPVSPLISRPVSPPISSHSAKRLSGGLGYGLNGGMEPINRPTSCPPSSVRMPPAHTRAQSMATVLNGFNDMESPRARGTGSSFNFSNAPRPAARRPPVTSSHARHGHPAPTAGTASMPTSMRRGDTVANVYRDGWSTVAGTKRSRGSTPTLSKLRVREEDDRCFSWN